MSIIPVTLPQYFNRFDPGDLFEELLFRPRGLQSAELNEIQSLFLDRLQRIADTIYSDGAVVSGTEPLVDSLTGAVTCPASAIYVEGAIRLVPERSFTIPTTGLVQIGVHLNVEQITELEDPSLRDPATGTKNFNEPGAGRLRVTPGWAHSGEGLEPFFSVYTVVNGSLLNQQPANTSNAFLDALRRYDREANGNYIVTGLEVVAVDPETFSVREGVGNIFGFKVDRPSAGRLISAQDPDLEVVTSEPDTYVNGSTPIQLNRRPVQEIQQVVATLEKSVTVTRGGAAGGSDLLPDVSVVSVVSVTRNSGATVYTSPADWLLDGDSISWSPGGTEPSPGSTYQVTYRYLAAVTPGDVDLNAGTFTVAGAVAGQLVLTDYTWKLPRFDRVCMDREGGLSILKGEANRFGPVPPQVPNDLLSLATITRNWIGTPPVDNDGVKAMPFSELQQVKRLVLDLFELVSLERLERDLASREPSSKLGIFVDPFIDDDLRDGGLTQTAAVVNGGLRLAIRPVVYPATANNASVQLLPYTEVPVIQQLLRTGSEKINPYQSFTPAPVPVVLNPSIDRWTEVVESTVWSEPSWDTFWIQGFGVVGGFLTIVPVQTRLQRRFAGTVVNEVDRRPVQNLRPIQVAFTMSGLDAGEVLTQLIFDGIPLPVVGIPAANGSGVMEGVFTVPTGVPAGTKLVQFIGDQGSFGAAQFIGEGTLVVNRRTPVFVPAIDPLAQTFRLQQGRVITSVDVWFTVIGDRSKPVTFEIRTTQVGIPDRAIAGGRLDMGPVTVGGFTRITLDEPIYLPAEEEFAITILTEDPTHELALGQLGRFDAAAGQWVIAQPYAVGTLLASSNASTWTPFQDKDLVFRLNAAQFTSNTRTVELGRVRKLVATSITRSGGTATVAAPGHGFTTGAKVVVSGADQGAYNGSQTITVTGPDAFTFPVTGSPATPATGTISLLDGDVSDLVALASVERPTGNTDVGFVFTRDDGQQFRSAENARIELTERLTTGLTLSAVLRGTPTESPFLFPGTQVMLGNIQGTGTYISRAFPCAANRRVNVIFDALIPAAAGAEVQIQNAGGTWVTVAPTATVPLGDNEVEYSHVVSSFAAGGATTRVRVNLTGAPGARPVVRNLRTVVI